MSEPPEERLADGVRSESESVVDAAGRRHRVLFEEQAHRLAGDNRCHLRRVFEAALREGIVPFRYLRNQQVLSTADQLTLCRSCAAVIGAGGLGGWVAELLARLGIGAMRIVDPDHFTESNLNRQRFARRETLGAAKVEVVKREISSINPGVEVSGFQERLSRGNGVRLVAGADLAVDGLDSIPARLSLQSVCEEAGIPMVHGAIAGFEGQVLTIRPGDPGIRNLYGEQPAEVSQPEAVLGVPAAAPLMIGGLQVMEVLKLLLDRPSAPAGTMLYLDLHAPALERFGFPSA
jgi:molybdopterin/thiamine biosynthesis adenylyltransferase